MAFLGCGCSCNSDERGSFHTHDFVNKKFIFLWLIADDFAKRLDQYTLCACCDVTHGCINIGNN